MQSTTYALVDCNNFFVSCERVFNPKLHQRPVVVLSNNDGCVISRSNEAKAIGIPMGVPLFKIAGLVAKYKIICLSSNFALYNDLSRRIMQVIASSVPEIEVYSIDEAFIPNVDLKTCEALVSKIEKHTGIPVSIGLAPTRTLAKIANHIVKKQQAKERVLYLKEVPNVAVQDIWGVGRKLSKRLEMLGIYTAQDLSKMPEKFIRKNFNVLMWNIVQELNGISCVKFEDNTFNKQQIMVSRSFAHKLSSLHEIREALVTHASSAALKVRNQSSVVGNICVFLHRGLYETLADYVQLPSKTADTRVIIKYASDLLERQFIPGHSYRKVGIILSDLSSSSSMQLDLFAHDKLIESQNLMYVIDQINSRLGHNTLQFAAAGTEKLWQTKANKKSKNFIGSWLELPDVSVIPRYISLGCF